MTTIEEIGEMIDRLWEHGKRPVLIEIGEKQARGLADDLNAHIPPPLDPVLSDLAGVADERPKSIAWQSIMQGTGWLYGIKVQGVESPDYLNVTAGE